MMLYLLMIHHLKIIWQSLLCKVLFERYNKERKLVAVTLFPVCQLQKLRIKFSLPLPLAPRDWELESILGCELRNCCSCCSILAFWWISPRVLGLSLSWILQITQLFCIRDENKHPLQKIKLKTNANVRYPLTQGIQQLHYQLIKVMNITSFLS